MRKIINNSGSSSILVVLTFMMLIIFSLLVVMSSHSDYKLAEKNAYNTKEYYNLKAKANEFWYNIDSILLNNPEKSVFELTEDLKVYDSDSNLEASENIILISKNFFNSEGRELLVEFKYDNSIKKLDLITIKELPKEFEYEEIEFEDVEVYTQ